MDYMMATGSFDEKSLEQEEGSGNRILAPSRWLPRPSRAPRVCVRVNAFGSVVYSRGHFCSATHVMHVIFGAFLYRYDFNVWLFF